MMLEPMHWQYMGALGGVIGVGWLVVLPMYRGWSHLNEKMTERVRRSVRAMAECEVLPAVTSLGSTLRMSDIGAPGRRRRPASPKQRR
jgi:hypothetical protein